MQWLGETWNQFSVIPGLPVSALTCVGGCEICSGYFPWSFHIGLLSSRVGQCQCQGQLTVLTVPTGVTLNYSCLSLCTILSIWCKSLSDPGPSSLSGGKLAAVDAKKSTVAVREPRPRPELSTITQPLLPTLESWKNNFRTFLVRFSPYSVNCSLLPFPRPVLYTECSGWPGNSGGRCGVRGQTWGIKTMHTIKYNLVWPNSIHCFSPLIISGSQFLYPLHIKEFRLPAVIL